MDFFNPNLGGLLALCFEVEGSGGKITPSKTCQSYARNLKFGTSIKAFLILIIPAFFFFFSKKPAYFSCVRAFLVLFSVFVRQKVPINENVKFTDYASGIRLPPCSTFAINQKNDDDVTICQHDIIVKIFEIVLFLLPSLVTGPSFITCFGLTAIFLYQGFIRNLEIGNTNQDSKLFCMKITSKLPPQ